MHISDGVLSLPVIAVGWGVTLTLLAITLWRGRDDIAEQIPKISVMTGAFFIASLINVPIPPTSVHLILNGLLGVVLGVLAYPAMFIGLTLQALLFQHGGITTIGVNTMNVGVPALVAYGIFKRGYTRGVSNTLICAIAALLAAITVGSTLFAGFGYRMLSTDGSEVSVYAIAAVAAAIITCGAFWAGRKQGAASTKVSGISGNVIAAVAAAIITCGAFWAGFRYHLLSTSMSEVSILVIGAAVLAAIAYCAFWAGSKGESIQILGAICGGLAVFVAAIFLAICLITTGEEFLDVAKVAVAAHIPIVIIESIITGSVVAFLVKVKPEMLPIDKEDEKK